MFIVNVFFFYCSIMLTIGSISSFDIRKQTQQYWVFLTALPANFDLSTCKVGEKFWCSSKRMCIEKSQHCDREVQCHDGSDEYSCHRFNKASGIYI
jgi:hypothetical protein